MYETWCETCKVRDEEHAVSEGKDPGKIPLHMYIGESSRSSYIRGKNHLDDARLLSTSSHMLKHYLDQHLDDRPEDMIFMMKVLSFKRSAYERQVHESVLIQQNKNHMLLNSRSEFNRCSIPRLTVKLGDKEMTELANSMRLEQKKEDDLEKTIRELKKQSKKRPNDQHASQQRNKRLIRHSDYRNYHGSLECLFSRSSIDDNVSNYDDCMDIALDEAIKLCGDIDEAPS